MGKVCVRVRSNLTDLLKSAKLDLLKAPYLSKYHDKPN